MRRPKLSLFFILVPLNGCVTFHAKPLVPERTAEAFESRTLTDPALRVFIEKNLHQAVTLWPPEAWDFTLLSLAAFYYHPDLDVARAQWGVAKAGQVTASERPNPNLSIAPEYAPNEPAGSSPWVAGVSLDIPIETAGKRGYRIDQSRAQSEAARMHIARVAWQVRSRVRSSLLALYGSQQTESILLAQQQKLHENRDLLEKRSVGGWVSPLNLTQAEVLSDKTDVALEEAQRQERTARGELADALGITVQVLDGVKLSLEEFDHPSFIEQVVFAELRKQALLTRSDLLEALADYAASQNALQLEIARQYPDIHLGPGYLFDQSVSRWGLSLLTELPIFKRNRGSIGEAVARREQAAATFIALQDQIIGEIDRALADYEAAHHKLGVADTLLNKHLEQDKSLQRLLHPGDLARLTLFRAQLDIDSTRLIVSDALVQFHQAEGAVEDALEHPLPNRSEQTMNAEVNPRHAAGGPHAQ